MRFNLNMVLFLLIFNIFVIKAQVSSDNEKVARAWIKQHSKELKLRDTDVFKLSFVRKSLSGETLRFQQMVNDVPVFQSEIVVHFNPNNEITNTSDSYIDKNTAISTTPSITEEAAKRKSNEVLKEKIIDGFSSQESKLFVNSQLEYSKLVYRVISNPNSGVGSWEVMIDAQTGEVISIKDVAVYHHKEKPIKKNVKNKKKEEVKNSYTPLDFVSGTGMIFNPDPLSVALVAYGGNYDDNINDLAPNDANETNTPALDDARSLVVLPEIDFTAGVYKLKSSYVEIKDFATPNKGLFTQTTPNFLFNRVDDGFEAVNAFYHLDKSMRYINEILGIVCRPTVNNGVLYFDPSGFNGNDNSKYTPGVQTLEFGEGGVDDAEDADVILHELGHGIHDWITAGNVSVYIGEGNGDYWAQSYSRSLNQWTSTQAAYQYIFNWDGHNEWWAGRTTNYSQNYPSGLVGIQNGACHTDGQIWATALMKIWDVIGREKTDKAFLEGLALTTSTSNQNQSAIAVRQAAIDMNYPCADIQTMTTKFASKGYTMPALPLTMVAIANQTVQADETNTYTLPSYASLANPIVANCNATLSQSPIVGTVLAPGSYPITMTAMSGASSVPRTFTLTITPNLGVNENVKQNVVIYPNPAKNQITLKGEFVSNESITIFNLLGQKVIERNSISNEERIDVSKLESGVYTIYFNNLKASYKFVKE